MRRIGSSDSLEAQLMIRQRAKDAAERARKLAAQNEARRAAAAQPAKNVGMTAQAPAASRPDFVGGLKPKLVELGGKPVAAKETAAELQDFRTQIEEVRRQWRREGKFLTVGEARQIIEERAAKRAQPETPVQRFFRLLDERAARDEAIGQAIATGESVAFRNSRGQEQKVSVARKGDEYEVRLGDDSFKVSFEATRQAPASGRVEAISSLTDWYSATPPNFREKLEKVNFTDKPYGTPGGGVALAYAGNGEITFLAVRNGDSLNSPLAQLKEGIFDHEMGHLIGQKAESERDSWMESVRDAVGMASSDDMVPDEWHKAVEADKATAPRDGNPDQLGNELVAKDGNVLTTEYAAQAKDASGNYVEDFAESWMMYQAGKKDPSKLAAFRQKYPHRAALLDEYCS